MVKDIYVVGDISRLVVKSIIEELKRTDCEIHHVEPEVERLKYLPTERLHLVLCLSEEIPFEVLQFISKLQKNIGLYLYTFGSKDFSIEEDEFFKKMPAVRFPTNTINLIQFLEYMERNDIAKKRILVVDDEPIMLRSIKNWLGDDFEVSLVNSGEAALQFLDMHPVDLVLLDYKMPVMDGPTVLKRIRLDKNKKNFPVIFLTAKNDRESVMTVMSLKPDGYILKSKEPAEIKKAVMDFFNNRIIIVEDK